MVSTKETACIVYYYTYRVFTTGKDLMLILTCKLCTRFITIHNAPGSLHRAFRPNLDLFLGYTTRQASCVCSINGYLCRLMFAVAVISIHAVYYLTN